MTARVSYTPFIRNVIMYVSCFKNVGVCLRETFCFIIKFKIYFMNMHVWLGLDGKY